MIEPPHTGLTRTRDVPRSQRGARRHTQDQACSAHSNSARERASCTRRGTEAGFDTLSRARSSRTAALIDGSFPVSARKREARSSSKYVTLCSVVKLKVGQTDCA